MPFVIIAILITLGAGTGTTIASNEALPGEALYSVKQAVESVQLAMARTPADKAAVLVDQLEKRTKEIEKLKDKSTQPEEIVKATEAAEKQQAAIEDGLDDAGGKDVEAIVAKLRANLERHQAVLERVHDQVPEHAKKAIERAQERTHGLERAIERQLTNPAASKSATPGASVTPSASVTTTATATAGASVTATATGGATVSTTPTPSGTQAPGPGQGQGQGRETAPGQNGQQGQGQGQGNGQGRGR